MSKLDAESVNRTVKGIRDRKQDGSSIDDIVSLAELSAESLQNFYRQLDQSVVRDLSEVSSYIEDLKRELAKLKGDDRRVSKLTNCGDELREVVAATEGATDKIMGEAENILAVPLDPKEPFKYQNEVSSHVIALFEACSFQDLTGQRISRVISTLENVEERINQIDAALNLRPVKNADFSIMSTESSADKRSRENMLNGPQNDGEGIGQSFIDAIFAIETKRTKSAS